MDPCEIGDVLLESVHGKRVRLTIETQQDRTTWTVAGARKAITWLQRWCETEESAQGVEREEMT